MAIVQQASGTFTGSSFTPTLPAASSSANCVVLLVAANTTINTPTPNIIGASTDWQMRTSQVAFMGHYLFDRKGVSLTSATVTTGSAGQGTWWIAEIASGVYDIATSANNTAGAFNYNTPPLTPTAGTREIIASIASTGSAVRTVSGWTNNFVEQADVSWTANDFPMQGVATLTDVAANGSTAYSTTATYSAASTGRSAIIASYVTGVSNPSVSDGYLTEAGDRLLLEDSSGVYERDGVVAAVRLIFRRIGKRTF